MQNTLHEIIREIPSYKKSQQDTSLQVITVNKETGEILDEPPMFSFGKKFRFYEIDRNAVQFDVTGPKLTITYANSLHSAILYTKYKARINSKSIFTLVRSIYRADTPGEAINAIIKQVISTFIFERKDFINEFTRYKKEVEQLINDTGQQCGLLLDAEVSTDIEQTPGSGEEQFINYEHKVNARTKDAQVVEIVHSLALTLIDPIKYRLSRMGNIRSWARTNLEQFTNNEIIDKYYADVLVSMEDSVIRKPMQEACRRIGYELKQLITVPGLDIEKFYFETMDGSASAVSEYSTKDTRLKIAINIIVDGRLDIHNSKTRGFIKPGFDIIAHMKKNLVEFAKVFINQITPDECFTRQFDFEDRLVGLLREKLGSTYGFKELGITVKFLETNLSRRLSLLQARPCKVELLADWTERRYALWFRILGVWADGWYRFRANNYQTRDEEVADISRMVRNGMETAILRIGEQISSELIVKRFSKVVETVRSEFGLEISIHDFNEELSDEELLMVKTKKNELDEKVIRNKMLNESETNELSEYLKLKETAISAEENEEVIKKLEARIAGFNSRNNVSKDKFLNQKTGNDFLLSPGEDKDNASADDSSKD